MILCCGEALVDMLPQKLPSGKGCFVPKVGGALFNTSLALGRLSVDVALLTGISNDFFGKILYEELKNSGVRTEYLVSSNYPTSLAFVEFSDQKTNYSFYTNGAAHTMLTRSNLIGCESKFEALLFGGISLCLDPTGSTMLYLMNQHSEKSITILDPNIRSSFISDEVFFRNRLSEMIALCDILKLSDEDLNWLVPKEDNLEFQIKKILGDQKKLVVITKGEKGASAFYGGALICEVPSIRVKVVDTVGAGDAFNAGLIYSLKKQGALIKFSKRLSKENIVKKALVFASKVSSITISREEANSPWLDEVTSD